MKKNYYTKSHRDFYNKRKILIIVLSLFISGCETIQTPIHKAPRNPKCEDIKSFKVFQVAADFVLANVCEDSDTTYCTGHTVIFKKERGKIYFDDQIIKVKDNECAIYTGTHQYPTKFGYKTVPIVKIIDSQNLNSE